MFIGRRIDGGRSDRLCIESKAAWELFGESAITGGIVTYNEKSYYVRGVYEDTNAVVILPAEAVFDKKQSGNSGHNNYPASDADKRQCRENGISSGF